MSTDLREARRDAGYTARDIAATLGVHPTTVHRWERHARRPAPAVVNHLAATLDADRAELVASLIPAVPAEPPANHRATGLRALRHVRGVSVAQIAAATEVPHHTVYNWEAGRSRLPERHVQALAGMLGLPRDRLLYALSRPATSNTPIAQVSPLRRLWAARGRSQASIAAALGVSRATVREWERGLTVPPWPALRRLAQILGTELATLAAAVGRQLPPELSIDRWRPGMIARVLVVLREWSDLTQAELARRLQCSVATVRSWERGRYVPSKAHRARLERLYRLPSGALMLAIGPAGSTMVR